MRAQDGAILLDLPRLELEGPGLVLVVGASGSGKTTLLRSATGLLPALAGLAVEGRVERPEPPARLGYLPQDALDAFLSFDVGHEFLLRLRAAGVPKSAAPREARQRLEAIGLARRERDPLVTLSAGERKRLALAAIQLRDPAVLLLDEPFNHLDERWRPRFRDQVTHAAERSLVVAATHDPAPLLPAAARVVVLRGGRVHLDLDPADVAARAADLPEIRLGPEPQTGHATSAGPERVRLDDVHHSMDGTPILRGATASWGPGLHAVVGPNGSGKTTLLRLLVGLAHAERGRVLVGGQAPGGLSPRELSRTVCIHFEDPAAAFFLPTVVEEIAFGPRNQGTPSPDVDARVGEAIGHFDLDPLRDRHPLSLSGGERERVALATIAAARTPVVLLDEPTHGLDAPGRRRLFALLDRLRATACVLVATHDVELADRCDTRSRLEGGRLTLEPPLEVACAPC